MLVLGAQSCRTLCDPLDCSPSGFSVHGILQAGILEWVAILLQRISWTQGSNPSLLHCRQILYHLSHQGSPGQPCNRLEFYYDEGRMVQGLVLNSSVYQE